MVATDKMLASVLSEIEELRAERVEAQDRIKYIADRLKKLGRIAHLLDAEAVPYDPNNYKPVKSGKTHRYFDDATKIKAVKYVKDHPDMTWTAVAEKFNVTSTTLRAWADDERYQ